jgi:hypothetical protein
MKRKMSSAERQAFAFLVAARGPGGSGRTSDRGRLLRELWVAA